MRFAAVALAGLLLGAVAPGAAQMPPGESSEAAVAPRGNPMFAGMSDTGRTVMRAANKPADPHLAHEETATARDRMLAVLEAERLDIVALRRAMDDEREAANAAKVRHQAAMIAGLQQLSLADRRVFVANARAIRQRMESRTDDWRQQRGTGAALPPPH